MMQFFETYRGRTKPAVLLRELSWSHNLANMSRSKRDEERTIANREGGDKPDEPGLRRIKETERFQERLAEVIDPVAIPEWLDTPNEAFGGLKPLEVIERGEIDRLWNMIFYLESGVAS